MRFVLSCLRVRELVSFLTDRIKSFFKKNVSSCLYGMCMCTHLRMWESTLPYECVCVLVPVGVGGVRAQVTQCLLSLTWHLHFWDLVFTRPVSRVWLDWLSSESWICTHAHKCTHMHVFIKTSVLSSVLSPSIVKLYQIISSVRGRLDPLPIFLWDSTPFPLSCGWYTSHVPCQ